MRLLFLFLAVIVLVTITSFTHAYSSQPYFTNNTFFAYNQTVIMFFPNGSSTTIHQVILQRVIQVFPNNSILVNTTVFNINEKNYLPPVLTLNNESFPVNLYFIPPNLLGDEYVNRGEVIMNLVGKKGDLYIYENNETIGGILVSFSMWVNQYGVAEKVETLQYSVKGSLVSNSTALLWLTNYLNSSVRLPVFYGFTEASVFTVKNGEYLVIVTDKIFEYIILAGIVAIIVILLIRK